MRGFWDRELVLVTGKGGVGKTTVAQALAESAHAAGRRVLLAEVTPDIHTPSPVLGPFGHAAHRSEEPVEMRPRLFGVRISPPLGHRLFLRAALKVRVLVDAATRSAALIRFLSAAPTFPEIGVLYQLVDLLRSKAYDHLIVDLPATGHAIGLASLPRVVLKIVDSGHIGEAMKEGLAAMCDPARTWAIVPSLPESMPVAETNDLITALYRVGIRIGATLLNQLPDPTLSPAERAALAELLAGRPRGILGQRELVRIDRALAAQAVFHRTIPAGLPRVEVARLEGAGERAVIDHVRRSLEQAFSSAEAT